MLEDRDDGRPTIMHFAFNESDEGNFIEITYLEKSEQVDKAGAIKVVSAMTSASGNIKETTDDVLGGLAELIDQIWDVIRDTPDSIPSKIHGEEE